MKSYVLGFMFTENQKEVVLIEKNRPAWQAGKLNGVGGHIESTDETNVAAMVREFREETGVETVQEDWQYYARMSNDLAEVFVFRSFSDKVETVETKTDEEVVVDWVEGGFNQRISNINWLISLALDQSTKFTESTF